MRFFGKSNTEQKPQKTAITIRVNRKEEKRFERLLKGTYNITQKGDLKWFIGIHITRDRNEKVIYLDQTSAIEQLLKENNLEKANIKFTPMITNNELVMKPNLEKRVNATEYRSLIGSLIHIMTGTRPDICFAVSKTSQFMQNPYESHKIAVMRILRYLLTWNKRLQIKIRRKKE